MRTHIRDADFQEQIRKSVCGQIKQVTKEDEKFKLKFPSATICIKTLQQGKLSFA